MITEITEVKFSVSVKLGKDNLDLLFINTDDIKYKRFRIFRDGDTFYILDSDTGKLVGTSINNIRSFVPKEIPKAIYEASRTQPTSGAGKPLPAK